MRFLFSRFFLFCCAFLLLAFPAFAQSIDGGVIDGGVAHIGPEIPKSIEMDSWAQWGALLVHAVQAKDYQFLVGLGLVFTMFLLRKAALYVEDKKEGWMGELGSFFASQFGGTVLLFVTAMMGGVGSALVGHVPVTGELFFDVAKMALLAAGGWSALVKPALAWFAARKKPAASAAPPPGA